MIALIALVCQTPSGNDSDHHPPRATRSALTTPDINRRHAAEVGTAAYPPNDDRLEPLDRLIGKKQRDIPFHQGRTPEHRDINEFSANAR
jgi:hypothetical protein